MRIVSLNAWGGGLHKALMPYLAGVDADVLCLQEVTRSPDVTADWLVYRDGDLRLPQRANLFEDIRALLPGHDASFFPTARGELFDGEASVRSEFGLATFVRRRYPVIAEAADFVHGSFSHDGWGPHPRSRNAHVLRLADHGGNRPVTIAQMHGLRDIGGKTDTPERASQAEALVALIERVRRDGDRLVVCGDFNLLPDSETFATLARLGLRDLVTTGGFTDTRTSHYEKAGRFADYLLVTPDTPVAAFDVVAAPEVSDHRALLVDLA